MIKFSKKQHEYILSILDKNKEIKNRIIAVSSVKEFEVEYNMDDNLEIDFYDFLQDKQVEIGYDKDYKNNENGEKIQVLIDDMYIQMEE